MSQLYPLLTIDEARVFESEVLGGDELQTLEAMVNAGQAIGIAILNDFQEIRDWSEFPQVLVLAGKGLNSGDAFVACSLMREALEDLQVTVVMTEEESNLSKLAAGAFVKLRTELRDDLEILDVEAYLAQEPVIYDVVLDGLYGHGFRPPLRKSAAELLQHVNNRTDILLKAAIDLPSGLGADKDPDSFVADFTYIPGVAKAPCFNPDNANLVGRVRFLEIDPFLDQSSAERLELVASPRSHMQLNQLRSSQSDKRSYGHCLILAGSNEMPGAAIMATLGSLHAGAGLVTTCTAGNVASQNAGAAPEAMWRALPATNEGGLEMEAARIVVKEAQKCHALLIGPGLILDRTTVAALNRIIREITLPLVLDASALILDIVGSVIDRPSSAGPVILTPHLGEFARLSGVAAANVRNEHLIEFSRKYRAITVLKGSPTRISDGKRCIDVPTGGPVLARGGSGDILAGIVTTLLAQSPEDPLSAAIQAVSWHGASADALARDRGATAVRTTDILPYLSSTLRA